MSEIPRLRHPVSRVVDIGGNRKLVVTITHSGIELRGLKSTKRFRFTYSEISMLRRDQARGFMGDPVLSLVGGRRVAPEPDFMDREGRRKC